MPCLTVVSCPPLERVRNLSSRRTAQEIQFSRVAITIDNRIDCWAASRLCRRDYMDNDGRRIVSLTIDKGTI